MFEEIKASVNRWNSNTSERQKLQHAYLAITVLSILVAGIASLIDANTGHNLTFIALIAILGFLCNAIVWNLLNSAVISRLSSKAKRR